MRRRSLLLIVVFIYMKIKTLENVLANKIEVLYDIEKQIEKNMPKLVKASFDDELKVALVNHLEDTRKQIKRLETIFNLLQVTPKETKSEGIRGMIADAVWVTEVESPDILRDIMIASSGRYIEHYEMAGYMSAIAEAKNLGLNEVVGLLEETLVEEKNADKIMEMSMQKSLNV